MSLKDIKPYVDGLKKDEKNAHGQRAFAAYSMLESSDVMIKAFFAHETQDPGQILLDVFGLMQGLFVAIDALYDLSIGLTKYKYHININANPKLHELKFIRNDLVGHPTHRSYQNGGIGFSVLDCQTLTQQHLVYKTYVYQKNDLTINEKEVEFKPLVDAYYEEREKLLSGLLSFVTKKDETTDLPERIYKLFETLNEDLLKDIKEAFIKHYQLTSSDHHRFIWRAELLKKVIDWHESEDDLNAFIQYMGKIQTTKMYEIALNLENRKNKDLYTKLPKLLNSFYRFIRRDEEQLLPLLEHLHDIKHPFFKSDLEALMMQKSSQDVNRLLTFLKNQTDGDKTYLIGSLLKAYRKRS